MTQLQVPVTAAMTNTATGIMQPAELLKLIDVAGCVPAKRHLGTGADPVTASLDRMNYHAPVHAWDIVMLDARMTQVWRTSMETRVVVTAWSFRTGEHRLIATAYLVAVAMQAGGQGKLPAQCVAPLLPITPEDHWLRHSAERRRSFRREEAHQAQWLAIDATQGDTSAEISQPMTAADGNGLGDAVFGGVILAAMHQAACTAIEQAMQGQQTILVRQDRTDFIAPARIGDMLRCQATLTHTWRTSAEVQVDCLAHDPRQPDALPRLVATTYMVFVGLSTANEPCRLPEWQPSTPRQHQRSQAAQVRRRCRQNEELF
jgi:acyl-CoA hydrolase